MGGIVDGKGTAVKFNYPLGGDGDRYGNAYFADSACLIRKMTSAAVVTTIAGLGGSCSYADGTGTNARFNSLEFLTLGWDGSLYVSDTFNYRLRKVSTAGVVTTYAGSGTSGYIDGTGTNAAFTLMTGVVGDPWFNIYLVEYSLHLIRKISPAGVVTTFAGSNWGYADGIGNTAQFPNPTSITADSSGCLYVTTQGGNSIRKITSGGSVTTFAGSTSGVAGYADGMGTSARFTCNNNQCSIDIDTSFNTLYVAERGVARIRRVTASGGVSTIAGTGSSGSSDGIGTSASFNFPDGIVFAGSVLNIADSNNVLIRSIEIGAVPAGRYCSYWLLSRTLHLIVVILLLLLLLFYLVPCSAGQYYDYSGCTTVPAGTCAQCYTQMNKK